MPAAGGTPSLGEILRRIEEIVSTLERLQARIEASTEQAANFRIEYEQRHARMGAEIQAVAQRLNTHEQSVAEKWERLGETEKQLTQLIRITDSLKEANNRLGWFSGIVGLTVIVWILNQLLSLL